jgi:D-3-phosphoglycerate dehydrogenase
MTKVVVAEEIAPSGIEALGKAAEVVVLAGAPREELLAALGDADALVVRSATDVDAELLAAAPTLRVVGRAGIGVDNIDLSAATSRGVMVVNAPQANIISAAEHTFALLLAQARNVARGDASLRDGRWERSSLKGIELHGKTLGIIGLGRIGTLVARRAAAFGMHLLAYDPYVSPESARRLGAEMASLDEVLGAADFITVHLPKTRETAGLLGAEAFAKMKDGVRIVNASRGGIVDEAALVEAVASGKVGGAGLDVFDVEPLDPSSPLLTEPRIVLSPHLGASTTEAQDKAGTDVAAAVVAALSGELVASAVNVDFGPPADEQVTAYLTTAEYLGKLFTSLARGLPERIELKIAGELAEHACGPLKLAFLKGALAHVSSEHVTYVNAAQLAAHRGIDVVMQTSSHSREFLSTVRVSGTLGERSPSVGATLTTKGPTLIGLDEMEIELPFGANMLLIRQDDQPGVIGRVGTYLGNLGINVANMVVGRSTVTGHAALMGLDLDQPLETEQVDEIRSLDGVQKARFLRFPVV